MKDADDKEKKKENVTIEEAFAITITLFKEQTKELEKLKGMLSCGYTHQDTINRLFICTNCGWVEKEWRR